MTVNLSEIRGSMLDQMIDEQEMKAIEEMTAPPLNVPSPQPSGTPHHGSATMSRASTVVS